MEPRFDGFYQPWATLYHSKEQYSLRYESKYLLELGQAMDYLVSFAVSMAAQEALKYTILAGLVSAIMWPASALTIASVIDNPWGVCCRRSAEVGKQLAQVLLSREHGHRPVTLIGFSLGARVIHFCLVEMAKAKNCQGIIQDVVLLGAPVSGSHKLWEPLGKVVSGRIINGYSRGDWLLKFLYRTSSMNIHIAGLGPLSWKNQRVFNFDLTDIVDGHLDYASKMDLILRRVGMRTRDDVTMEGDDRLLSPLSSFPTIGGNLFPRSQLRRTHSAVEFCLYKDKDFSNASSLHRRWSRSTGCLRAHPSCCSMGEEHRRQVFPTPGFLPPIHLSSPAEPANQTTRSDVLQFSQSEINLLRNREKTRSMTSTPSSADLNTEVLWQRSKNREARFYLPN